MFQLSFRFDNVEEQSNIPCNKRQNEALSRREKPKRMKLSGPDSCVVFIFSLLDVNLLLLHAPRRRLFAPLQLVTLDGITIFISLISYHYFHESFFFFLVCMVIKLKQDASFSSKLFGI